MFLAFLILLLLNAAVGVLGWRRIAAHLNSNESAKKYFFDHVVSPLLLGHKEPKAEGKP